MGAIFAAEIFCPTLKAVCPTGHNPADKRETYAPVTWRGRAGFAALQAQVLFAEMRAESEPRHARACRAGFFGPRRALNGGEMGER